MTGLKRLTENEMEREEIVKTTWFIQAIEGAFWSGINTYVDLCGEYNDSAVPAREIFVKFDAYFREKYKKEEENDGGKKSD